MRKTWKPITAGILDIIYGWSVGSILMLGMLWGIAEDGLGTSDFIFLSSAFIMVCLAFAGGIYATLRKRWWLSLVGSIGAFFLAVLLPVGLIIAMTLSSFISSAPFVVFGLIAIIAGITPVVLTALSKNEFK